MIIGNETVRQWGEQLRSRTLEQPPGEALAAVFSLEPSPTALIASSASVGDRTTWDVHAASTSGLTVVHVSADEPGWARDTMSEVAGLVTHAVKFPLGKIRSVGVKDVQNLKGVYDGSVRATATWTIDVDGVEEPYEFRPSAYRPGHAGQPGSLEGFFQALLVLLADQ